MTPNEEYALVHAAPELAALEERRRQVVLAGQTEFDDLIAAERERIWQAGRRPGSRRPKSLPEPPAEWLKGVKESLYAKYGWRALIDERDRLEKERSDRLDALAPSVVLAPDPAAMYDLRWGETASYSTQGYGDHKYARGWVEHAEMALKRRGFTTYVRWVQTWKPQGLCDGIGGGRYELWADCPEWMFDAVERVLGMDEVLADMRALCVNPRVYFPFLGYEGRYADV